jgi:hypothetical protein
MLGLGVNHKGNTTDNILIIEPGFNALYFFYSFNETKATLACTVNGTPVRLPL